MANTYTQIYIQIIFAVQNRQSSIKQSWKEELYKYITGIIQNNNHKMIAINGTSNHIHILIGYKHTQLMSDLIRDIKASSSKWINHKGFVKTRFNWQEGYGAFSYSHSHLDHIIKYINDQELHHKKTTFTEEYKSFLEKFKIAYNEKYILKDV